MKAVVVNPEGTGVEIVTNKDMRPLETGEALVQIEYCGVRHGLLHVAHGDFSVVSQAVFLDMKESELLKNFTQM